MKKKKVVAMLLAGGQGTRLMALTSKVAKPAVSFGSKYRIIDFTLSNCANSSIDTVGILTQYEPMVLNNYIGNGKSWDLDRYNGGAHILSPYQGRSAAGWYKGTANAVFQNLQFLDKYDSEHVLILSGDHIYKMDYSIMLASHIKNNADCTIAVIGVGREEASRFGIMSYDSELRITDFEEKPKHPKSDRASMGVYIFKKDVLVQELTEDDKTAGSSNDFGKNIIPKMLKEGARMFAYPFEGYWKDVGTVESLWSANMDLLGANPQMDLRCEHMRVYANNEALPPCFIADGGEVKNSLVTAGCEIGGRLENCVVSENVTVGEGSVIKNSILMRGSVVGSNVKMDYCIVDEYTRIGDGCVIGEGGNKESIVLVGSGCVVKGGTVLKPGVVVE